MKRKFGIPALALILALSSMSLAVPNQAVAGNSGKVLGALVGGVIIGSTLKKQSYRSDHRRNRYQYNQPTRFKYYNHRSLHRERATRNRHHGQFRRKFNGGRGRHG